MKRPIRKKCEKASTALLIENLLPSVLSKYFDRKTREWHRRGVPSEQAFLASLTSRKNSPLLKIHYYNFNLWHTEDEARRPHVRDSVIASTKREVDRLNQLRNDAIEEADARFASELEFAQKTERGAKLNTETIGSVIDRLSILSLKIYHMGEEAVRKSADGAHRTNARERRKILRSQRKNLEAAAADLVVDLLSGKKTLKPYRQFKMYNDPTLNPAIYSHKKKKR